MFAYCVLSRFPDAVRPFTLSVLRAYWARHPQAEKGLREWWDRTETARWRTFVDVRRDFSAVDLVSSEKGDKLVFNIGGNKFRLVVLVKFGNESMYVLWVGTHAEYDRLNVKEL